MGVPSILTRPYCSISTSSCTFMNMNIPMTIDFAAEDMTQLRALGATRYAASECICSVIPLTWYFISVFELIAA